MAQVRVLILRAPGTNCDQETAFAFQQAGASAEVMHINRLLESPQQFDDYQVLCLPGGFSYGDDIAAGRIVAAQLRHHLVDTLIRFRDAGKLVLGICNGFQVLLKSGLLLPDDPGEAAPATLTWNDSGQFIDRWVDLQPSSEHCVSCEASIICTCQSRMPKASSLRAMRRYLIGWQALASSRCDTHPGQGRASRNVVAKEAP